jgi:sulfur relay (sulfurtransferase) DsrC/TusE family protein
MSEGIYTKDVVDILDLFYANDGEEPDWAAIKTRLFSITDSHYKVIISLLRAFYAVYEDPASFATVMYRLGVEMPDQ